MKNHTLMLVFSCLCFQWSNAQTPDLSRYKQQVQRLSEDVAYFDVEKINDQFYMIIGGGGNVGVFVGDSEVILIDNKYEVLEAVLMDALRTFTDKPIKYMINTHFHHDHSDGNKTYGKQGIPIIAHENAKKRMQATAELYGGILPFLEGFVQDKYPENALPVITYDSKISLHESGEHIELYHFGYGHTDGDSVVYFTKANIMHTGDTFVGYRYPYVDLYNGGSIQGIIQVLENIAAITNDDTIIMPGHGPISSRKEVLQIKTALTELYEKTLEGLKQGRTPKAIAASIPTTVGKAENIKLNYIKSIALEQEQVERLTADRLIAKKRGCCSAPF